MYHIEMVDGAVVAESRISSMYQGRASSDDKMAAKQRLIQFLDKFFSKY